MYLKNLEIKNFKNISNKKFEFNKINLISGSNGSGKSSTLESIIFLLTDYLNGKLSEYIKWGTSQFSLDTWFEDTQGKNFNYRIDYDKATKRYLITDNDQYTGTDAVKFLREKIDPNIALFSNISIQGQSTQLLYEKPTARLEKFKLLFGIEDVDKAVEKINMDIEELRSKIKLSSSEIEILKSKTFTYMEEYDLPDSKQLQVDFEAWDNDRLLYELNKKKYDEYLVQLKEYEKNVKFKEEFQRRINSVDVRITKLEESKKDIQLKRVAKPVIPEDQIQEHEKLALKLYTELTLIKSKYEAIQDGKCPTCGAEYAPSQLDEYKTEYETLKANYQIEHEQVEKLRQEWEQYKKICTENDLKQEKIKTVDSQIYALQSERDSYRSQFDSCQEIKEPEAMAIPTPFDYITFEKYKKELYVLKEREENLKKIKEHNIKIKLEEKDHILDISKKQDELDNNHKRLNLLETSRKILSKDFSSYLIDKGTTFVKNKMNEIFARSYGKYNITLDRNSKGVDFFYSSPENNILTSVEMASGYEKQLLSVSFRLALANLHRLGIFIFDEIDSDSSEENSLKLYRTILAQKYSQLFIVTHKETTKDYLRTIPYCSEFEF